MRIASTTQQRNSPEKRIYRSALYGKRRLREIDRRTRYLIKRLDAAEVNDPANRDIDQIFFGATVTVVNLRGDERTVSIVGLDVVDPQRGYAGWVSPIARALTRSSEGDVDLPTLADHSRSQTPYSVKKGDFPPPLCFDSGQLSTVPMRH